MTSISQYMDSLAMTPMPIKPRLSTCPHQAFSLVEMLVAVAILSILASLLSPALTKALNTASGMQCASTLKTLGQIDNAYANDHNETFLDLKTIGENSSSTPYAWYSLTRSPSQSIDPTSGPTYNHIPNALESYGWQMTNSSLLCPDEKDIPQDFLDTLTSFKGRISYTYRGSLNGYYDPNKWTTPLEFQDGPHLWLRFCQSPKDSLTPRNEHLVRSINNSSLFAYDLQLNPNAPVTSYRHYEQSVNVLYTDLAIQTKHVLETLDLYPKKLEQRN